MFSMFYQWQLNIQNCDYKKKIDFIVVEYSWQTEDEFVKIDS